MRRIVAMGLVLLLAITGCGGTDASFISSESAFLDGDDVVFGRILLEKPAAGGTADLTDLTGVPLGYPPAVVDESGNFRIRTNFASLPKEFRVRVRLDSSSPWDLPLLADVRDYNETKAVYCNILTTVAALYRQKKGVSAEEARQWVRSAFGIADSVDIGWGLDESTRSVFRHSVFLSRAVKGSVAGHIDALIENDQVAAQLGVAIAVSLLADLATDAIGAVAGTLAQAMGLNIGDNDDIDQLANQLTEIQNQIDQLNTQLMQDYQQLLNATEAETLINEYNSLSEDLGPTIADLETMTADLISAASDTTITNEPFAPRTTLTNVLSNIASYNAEAAIELLTDTLLGRNQSASLFKIYQQLLAIESGVQPLIGTGNSSGLVFSSTPILTNTLIYDRFERLFDYYVLNQILALNLLVENANLSQDQSTIEIARDVATALSQSLVEESMILGFPLASDSYLANPQAAFEVRSHQPIPSTPSGTLFYTQFQAPVFGYTSVTDDGQAFIDQTTAFQAPGYGSGWRLPSLDELRQLRALALEANPSNAITGLESLGFSLPSGSVWYADYDDPNVSFGVGVYYLKVFNFQDGATQGYDPASLNEIIDTAYPYIQVHDLPFDSSQTFEHIVAAGFRPTTAPQLALYSGNTKVVATLNGEDISEYCVFTSSDPSQLEVDNLGEDVGKLTWHPGAGTLANQTITATIQGMDAATGQSNQLQATISVSVPSPTPVRQLSSIVVTPSNLILLDKSVNTPFKATAYYEDQTLADVTDQVTWELLLPNGFPYPSLEATINGSIPGVLIFITPIVLDSELTVQATLGDVVGQTQVEVASP